MEASLRVRPHSGQPHVHSVGAAAGFGQSGTRWQSSSRRQPCPICSRNTDDKCRWQQDLIACHQGDRFSPPAGLRVGDVVTVQGSPWAVVKVDAGFSGQAVLFRPHVDRNWFTPAEQRRERKVQAALLPTLQELFSRCRACVQLCLAMPELERCTVPQLQAELAHAKATVANLTALHGPLVKARREAPEMGRFVKAIDHWLELVSHQLEDVERFLRVQLGTPTAEQIAAVEAA